MKRILLQTACWKILTRNRFFQVANTENSTVIRISFEISKEITAAKKSFIEEHFIKKGMEIAMSVLC